MDENRGCGMQFFKSTKQARNFSRVSVAAALADGSLGTFSHMARIPTKTAQVVSGLACIFCSDTKAAEKAFAVAETVVSVVQMGFIVTAEFSEDEWALQALSLCDLLYQGLLMSRFSAGEISKEPLPQDELQQFIHPSP